MPDFGPVVADHLWMAGCFFAWRRFRRALYHPEKAQARLLKKYLVANRDTDYGRRRGFARITDVASFQKTVPLTTYDDYGPAIERIGQGEPAVLTTERVRMFELSSGSTAASKLIPYTGTLKAEFQRAVAPWVFDLYSNYPQLARGTAYWSVTPLVEGRRVTPGGIPIGFEEDSAYLGAWSKYLVEAALAVPNAVKQIQNVECFRYVTLLFMLRQSDLCLISVWNPTFLTLLLAPLGAWWERLVQDIAEGTQTPPTDLNPELRRTLGRKLRPDPRRARELADTRPGDYRAIWPKLALISCWADGPAAGYARALSQEQFPGILLQGKGLLATEACVSIPIVGVTGSVLAITSHFLEFLPLDDSLNPVLDSPRQVHQLERGKTYAVVVTTGGGFYRYQLRDVVEVTSALGQVPTIRFIGKTDRVSDRFGEKLDERFVAAALERIFKQRGLSPLFAMLAPDDAPPCFHYTLYLELAPGQSSAESAATLAQDLERELCANFHYAYCRKLGQLGPARVARLSAGATEIYLRACQARGQKLGNVKPTALHPAADWRHRFEALL